MTEEDRELFVLAKKLNGSFGLMLLNLWRDGDLEADKLSELDELLAILAGVHSLFDERATKLRLLVVDAPAQDSRPVHLTPTLCTDRVPNPQ